MTYNENILKGLTEEEKSEVLKILNEISKEGKSSTYEDLLYQDYNEIPVDIETFLDDYTYLGASWHDAEGKTKLYPFWRKQLKELFPTNTTINVNTFIASGARGLGKSEIAVAIACYLLYRVMCLKDPIEYYHLKPTEKICFAFMNIKLALAEDVGISKFQNTIKLSPWFMERGEITGRTKKVWNPPKYIQIITGSQADDVIGLPIFFAFFDEISFIRNQDIDKQKEKAINMIDTAIGGMKTRFIHGGKNPTLLALASSKRSEKSFLETHIKQKLKSENENVQIVDEAVWNVKPKGTYKDETFKIALGNKFLVSQVIPDGEDENLWINKGYKIIEAPIDFKANFIDDIERALCDYAGVSSSEISKYISGAIWRETVNTAYTNPFQKEILEIGNSNEDTLEYKNFFDMSRVRKEYMRKPLFIHLDMSIAGDMTGISGVWISGKKPSTTNESSSDLFFTLAFSVSIKAPKGHQISFEKNRNFIRWLKEQGFNIQGISTDSFQSYDTGQTLKKEGYNYDQVSVDKVNSEHVCVPYQYFKSCIYEKRLETFEDKTLTEEIIDLERNINSGKIDHPDGGRKDAADSVCGALYNASQYADKYAYDFGEDVSTAVFVNESATTGQTHQQVQVMFEKQLQEMFGGQNIMEQKINQQTQATPPIQGEEKQEFTSKQFEKAKPMQVQPPSFMPNPTAKKPVVIERNMLIW